MWIKLVKHIGEGSLWYSFPSDNQEVKFVAGDLVSCKFADGTIEKLPIAFRDVPWIRKKINDIPYQMELKSPYIIGKNSIIELEEIEVDDYEVSKYKNSK